MPKPRRRWAATPEVRDAILAAYRLHPGNHKAAARVSGFDADACRRLWERGWPAVGAWAASPLRDVIDAEQRARDAEKQAREAERADLERRRAERRKRREDRLRHEQSLLDLVRENAVVASAEFRRLGTSMRALSIAVENALLTPPDAQGRRLARSDVQMKPEEALGTLRAFAAGVATLALTEQRVLRLGREEDETLAAIELAEDELETEDE